MSKIGRNDPCPCGSGTKYKKCCIDKALNEPEIENLGHSFKKYLENFWKYDEVNEMSTEEIINNLKSMGIAFEKERFLEDIEKFYSAEEISNSWFETFDVTATGRDEDFPFFAVWVLWERLAPKDMLCTEQISNLIDNGYECLSENDSKSACDLWLRVWNAIKYRSKPEIKTLESIDDSFGDWHSISNLCVELEFELANAGFEDSAYYEKRIDYCKEFCEIFSEEGGPTVHNRRRAIAESYVSLRKFDEAKKALDELVKDYPNNPWSYIEYGDMYLFEDDLIEDSSKAKELYNKALLVAKDETDKQIIADRLEDLK